MADDDLVEVKHHVQHRYPAEARFCPLCAAEMQLRLVLPDRRPFKVCPACAFVDFPNPKLVAGCLIVRRQKILLLKRGNEPALGKWTFPGGYVDLGETPSAAAIRETREEVGLDATIIALSGLYCDPARPGAVVAAYLARADSGEPQLSIEATEVRFFDRDEIPWDELAFETTRAALKEWAAKSHIA